MMQGLGVGSDAILQGFMVNDNPRVLT